MNERARRAVILLPVLGTVVLAAVIGVLVVVHDQRQSDQVAAADTVAQDYLADVASLRISVVRRINAADQADLGKLQDVVERAVSQPPRLPTAPEYGMEHSKAYAEAVRVQSSFLEPYRRLIRTLDEADASHDFIVAARRVLGLRATDYLGSGLITSSAQVRSSLIPAFVKARDEFDRVTVPKGQAKLAATVRGAMQYVVDQAGVLADRIDAHQNFSFTYHEQFQNALDAVNDYATVVQGDVDEAISAITAGPQAFASRTMGVWTMPASSKSTPERA
jgi:hypothetical protein